MKRYTAPEKEKPLQSARTRQRAAVFYFALVILPASLLHIYNRGLAAAVTGGERGIQYEVVIDAGSSGSRVHIFKYTFEAGADLPRLQLPDLAFKTTPGLSSYAARTREAGDSLLPLVEFAVAKVIPAPLHSADRLGTDLAILRVQQLREPERAMHATAGLFPSRWFAAPQAGPDLGRAIFLC